MWKSLAANIGLTLALLYFALSQTNLSVVYARLSRIDFWWILVTLAILLIHRC